MPRTRNIASLQQENQPLSASTSTRTRSRNATSSQNPRRNDGEKENDGRKPARSTRLHRSAAGILGAAPLGLRNPPSMNNGKQLAAAAAPSPADPKKPKKKGTKTTTKREKVPLQDITSQFVPAAEGANRGEGFQLIDDDDVDHAHVDPQNVVSLIEPTVATTGIASPLPPSSPPAYLLHPSDPAQPPRDSIAKVLFESQLSSPSRLAQPSMQAPWDDSTVPQAEFSDSSTKSDPFGFVALERKLKAERHYETAAGFPELSDGFVTAQEDLEDLDELPIAGTDSPRPVRRLKRSHDQDDEEEDALDDEVVESTITAAVAVTAHSSPILPLRPAPPTPHKDKKKRPRLSHETHNIFSPCASSIESSPSPTKASARKSILPDPLENFNASFSDDDAFGMIPPTSALRPRKRLLELDVPEPQEEQEAAQPEEEEPVQLRRSARAAARKSVGAEVAAPSPMAGTKPKATRTKKETQKARSRSRGSPLKKARQTKEQDEDDAEKLERERQDRIDYFKRLDEYQLETEDVYII